MRRWDTLAEAYIQEYEARGIHAATVEHVYIERFNRIYRHEVLDAHVFESLEDVRRVPRQWIREDNEERPHDSLGRIPPAMFRRQVENARNSNFELSH